MADRMDFKAKQRISYTKKKRIHIAAEGLVLGYVNERRKDIQKAPILHPKCICITIHAKNHPFRWTSINNNRRRVVVERPIKLVNQNQFEIRFAIILRSPYDCQRIPLEPSEQSLVSHRAPTIRDGDGFEALRGMYEWPHCKPMVSRCSKTRENKKKSAPDGHHRYPCSPKLVKQKPYPSLTKRPRIRVVGV